MYLEIDVDGDEVVIEEDAFLFLQSAPVLVLSRDNREWVMYECAQLMVEHEHYGGVWVSL